jgi:hypothetical protein
MDGPWAGWTGVQSAQVYIVSRINQNPTYFKSTFKV